MTNRIMAIEDEAYGNVIATIDWLKYCRDHVCRVTYNEATRFADDRIEAKKLKAMHPGAYIVWKAKRRLGIGQ